MDVLENRYPSKEIAHAVRLLRFGNQYPKLVGTGALASQLYPADYDLMVKLGKSSGDPESIYEEFKRILKDIQSTENLFFIEFKFQYMDGDKYKIYSVADFTKNNFIKRFHDVEYCKIDMIINIEGHFKEMSCNYIFGNTPADLTKLLLKDAEHYYESGNYYKALKRILVATKYKRPVNRKLIVAITELFNSAVGDLYLVKNEIDACIIFLDKYSSKLDQKAVKAFLSNIGMRDLSVDKLKDLSTAYGDLINKEALKFFNQYKLSADKLPPYNKL